MPAAPGWRNWQTRQTSMLNYFACANRQQTSVARTTLDSSIAAGAPVARRTGVRAGSKSHASLHPVGHVVQVPSREPRRDGPQGILIANNETSSAKRSDSALRL